MVIHLIWKTSSLYRHDTKYYHCRSIHLPLVQAVGACERETSILGRGVRVRMMMKQEAREIAIVVEDLPTEVGGVAESDRHSCIASGSSECRSERIVLSRGILMSIAA